MIIKIFCVPQVLSKKSGGGGHNKYYVFLNKFCFYSFSIESLTATAKKIRTQIIDVYNNFHDLLIYCKFKDSKQIEAIKLVKEKSLLKHYLSAAWKKWMI